MKETALKSVHVDLGARMVDFAGWEMPVQYTSILEEAAQVRNHAGLFDLGALLGGLSLGFLIDGYGYSAMFVSAGGCVVLGTIVYVIWDAVAHGPTASDSA